MKFNLSKINGIITLTRPYVLISTLFLFIAAAFLSVNNLPPLIPFFIGIIATALAIASAHTINDYSDRIVDKENPRTAQRPIPSGLVPPTQALFLGLSFGVFAVLLTFTLNPLCILLAFFGTPLPFVYNYLRKRQIPISFICTVLAVLFIILFGSASVSGQLVPNSVWLFAIFGMAWELGRTMISEVQDVDADKESAVTTISVVLSSKRAAWVIFLFFAIAASVNILIGFVAQLGFIYIILSFLAAIWLLYRTLELVRKPTGPNAIQMKVRAPKYLIVVSLALIITIMANTLLGF
jgi:4-hydroxybenzoate polyprenyltransferase